jgi:hypothetical protein
VHPSRSEHVIPYLEWVRAESNFAAKAGPVLDLYQRVWEGAPLGADDYVICADERPVFKLAAENNRRCRWRPIAPPTSSMSTSAVGAWTYLAAWDVHQARVFGRCEVKSGIAPVNRLVGEVMDQEPYKSARRVFWIADNCSAHRGQKAANRLRDRWPNLILIHTPVHASWLNQVEIYFSIVRERSSRPTPSHLCRNSKSACLPFSFITSGRHALQLDLHPPRSPCSSGQDRRQTAGSRSLTEYVTVIQFVSTKLKAQVPPHTGDNYLVGEPTSTKERMTQ